MTNLTKTLPKKTHWKKLFNPDYMGAWSIDPGEEPIYTIKSVALESVTGSGGSKQDCTVIRWVENQKPFIVNNTNAKSITKSIGSPYIEDWKGNKIKLFVQSGVKAFGDIVDALRVRPNSIKKDKPVMNPEHKNWSKMVLAIVQDRNTIKQVRDKYELSREHESLIIKAKNEADAKMA